MRITLRFAALIILVLLSAPLHAAPGDAAAVLQQCGTPQSDTMAPGTGTGIHPSPQRVLTYSGIGLHFDKDPNGWIFLFATQRKRTNITRSETERLLPCFAKAMYAVESHEPQKIVATPAAPPPTLSERIAASTNLLSPVLITGIIVLYLLPSLLAFIRRPLSFVKLVTINVLFGWTVIGWIIPFRMVFGDRRRFTRTDSTVWPPAKEERASAPEPIRTLPPIIHRETAVPQKPASVRPRRSAVEADVPAVLSSSAVTLPTEPSRPGPIAYSSSPPKLVVPSSGIDWLEQYTPERPCRIEVSGDSNEVTLYEMELTCRGVDGDGREYLGGLIARSFCVFPRDRVLRISEKKL